MTARKYIGKLVQDGFSRNDEARLSYPTAGRIKRADLGKRSFSVCLWKTEVAHQWRTLWIVSAVEQPGSDCAGWIARSSGPSEVHWPQLDKSMSSV